MDSPCITVGVPVYKGSDVIGETLLSIQQQSYRNFRVNISIDGADETSRLACNPFLRDSRFNLISHNHLRGWAGNVNWLLRQARTEYFCYYPHDDLTESTYFETLLAEAARRPTASVVYSDIKFFENRDDWSFCESIVGDPFIRVMTFLEILPFHAFRGLIRHGAMRTAGLLRVNEYDSCMEDLVWLLKVARSGDMIRVPKTLYFKRWHSASTSMKWLSWPQERRREPWIAFCVGLLGSSMPAARRRDERYRILFAILDRLLKNWFYEPEGLTSSERRQLVIDFIKRARRERAINPIKLFWRDWRWLGNQALERYQLGG